LEINKTHCAENDEVDGRGHHDEQVVIVNGDGCKQGNERSRCQEQVVDGNQNPPSLQRITESRLVVSVHSEQG